MAADVIKRLQQEIDALKRLQAEALKTATYVGMTPDEAKQFDERSKRVTRLGQELNALQGTAMGRDQLPPDERVC